MCPPNEMPDVSVVIPVLNDQHRLNACLGSLVAQDLPRDRYEIIVVDNGSSDDSRLVAEQHGATVLCFPDLKVGALRNRGVEVARGQVIGFVDSDHLVSAQWIRKAIESLHEHSEYCMVGCECSAPADGTWVQRVWELQRFRRRNTHEATWLGAGNMFVRRHAFDEVGGFREDITASEDVDLCDRVRSSGGRILADFAIANVHVGEPETLREFFRKEFWRGSSGLPTFFAHGCPLQELPSLAFPAYHLVGVFACSGAALLSWRTGNAYFFLGALAVLVAPSVLISLRTTAQSPQAKRCSGAGRTLLELWIRTRRSHFSLLTRDALRFRPATAGGKHAEFDDDGATMNNRDRQPTEDRDALPTRPVVLHVRVVTDEGGGPEKTILNSPRFLETFGYNAICAYMHPPHDPGFATLEERAVQAGAQLESIADRGPLDWRVLGQLVRLCRQYKVSIWHAHEYKSDILGILARRFWPMKLVTTVHGFVQSSRRMKLYNKLDTRFWVPRYDEVMAVSEDLYQRCLEWGVADERRHLVRNAIDTAEFRRTLSTEQAKQQCGASTDVILVGAVGRLSAEKGFDRLIRAVDQVIASGIDVNLWIAGEGKERAELERLIGSLGRQDHMRLLGHVKDPKQFFQSLDMYVLSSLTEGLPNVVLEAMALEVPVIATRVAGLPALLDNGEHGILINPDSVDEIATAIRDLAQDRQLRMRFASSSRQAVERSYSFEERMRKVADIYDGLMARRSAEVHQPAMDANR